MISEYFKNIMLKAKKDIAFTDENYHEKLNEIPKLIQDYLNRSMVETEKLKNIYYEKEELFKERYNFYKLESDVDYRNKEEICYQIYGETDFIEKQKEYDEQERIVKYLETSINNLKSLFYDIKLYHDIKLFKNGIFK